MLPDLNKFQLIFFVRDAEPWGPARVVGFTLNTVEVYQNLAIKTGWPVAYDVRQTDIRPVFASQLQSNWHALLVIYSHDTTGFVFAGDLLAIYTAYCIISVAFSFFRRQLHWHAVS